MLNRATKLMNKQMSEREAAADKARAIIADAQEALRVLGFEEVSLDKVIDTKPIIINKGHVVAVEVTNEEELDRLYEENRRHIRRIEQLTNENEQLTNDVNELKAQLTKDADHETVNSTDCDATEEQETMKGGDAMSTPEEQPKRNPLLDKIKRAPEFTLEQAVINAEADAARKAEEKEEAKSQFPKYTLEYDQITFDESIDSRTMFGVRGTITIEDKTHFFEATNNHHMPIVYGCMDEEFIRLTKEIIMHEIERFSFMNEREKGAADYSHINDAENPLVVWRLTDDKGNITYHGYDKTRLLTWDKKKFANNYVGRKMIRNVFEDEKATGRSLWKKLTNGAVADKFRAICASVWPEDFTNDDNDPEPTKEQHQQTKEQHQSTKEFFHITKEQHQTTNDEEIKVTKEQHQNTYEYILDTPIDNFGETKDVQDTNDDGFASEADDLDF